MGWKREWAKSRANWKRKSALLWVPIGPLFAALADWPVGLIFIPLCWLVAAFHWWLAGVEERYMLRTFEKYGEDHPWTSWSALGRWIRSSVRGNR